MTNSVADTKISNVDMGFYPTPLERLPRLSAHLGGPEIWIKRDDCTGLAGGGNKVRKLEYLVAEARRAAATTLVTVGGIQSNHARQTAAAAAKSGLGCTLILDDTVADRSEDFFRTGNILYSLLLGADVKIVPAGGDRAEEAKRVVEDLRARGETPYFIPVGGSNGTGARAYAEAAQELVTQCSRVEGLAGRLAAICVATGTTGTQAGIVAGLARLGLDIPVRGFSVGSASDIAVADLRALEHELVGVGLKKGYGNLPLHVDDSQIGTGYGQPTQAGLEAIELLARQEGILLDPVYTGKAMAGLIAAIRAGEFKPCQSVVFWHTGGAQSLSAYSEQFRSVSQPARAIR